MSPAAYDRNDLAAPGFEIITVRSSIRGWSSIGTDEQARRALDHITLRGDRVLRAWINPGPDRCLGSIYSSDQRAFGMSDTTLPLTLTRTFTSNNEFGAVNAAEADLKARGFSVARPQSHAPSGILLGLYDIQKWRNLRTLDREALHGQMTGDFRNGPVTVRIFDTAPDEAKEAFCREIAAAAALEQAA